MTLQVMQEKLKKIEEQLYNIKNQLDHQLSQNSLMKEVMFEKYLTSDLTASSEYLNSSSHAHHINEISEISEKFINMFDAFFQREITRMIQKNIAELNHLKSYYEIVIAYLNNKKEKLRKNKSHYKIIIADLNKEMNKLRKKLSEFLKI